MLHHNPKQSWLIHTQGVSQSFDPQHDRPQSGIEPKVKAVERWTLMLQRDDSGTQSRRACFLSKHPKKGVISRTDINRRVHLLSSSCLGCLFVEAGRQYSRKKPRESLVPTQSVSLYTSWRFVGIASSTHPLRWMSVICESRIRLREDISVDLINWGICWKPSFWITSPG